MEENMRLNIKWKEIPLPAKIGAAFFGSIALILMIIAQVDITKRDRKEIVGPKLLWRFVALIEIIGPVIYFKMVKEVRERLK